MVSEDSVAYEIKQGEVNKGKSLLSNEYAGLILLAMDLAQPWSCHQKYKVMDELHSEIFGSCIFSPPPLTRTAHPLALCAVAEGLCYTGRRTK